PEPNDTAWDPPSELALASARGDAPAPPPPIEELPPRGAGASDVGSAPPPLTIEALPPRSPEAELAGADEPEFTIDRFGRRRTRSGALVLGEAGEGGDGESAGLGLTNDQRDALAGGGFFDVGAFDDVKVV